MITLGQHGRRTRRYRFRTDPRSIPAAGRGFTLVEVMMTVAVAAILVAIGLPAMRTLVQNDRQWTQANTLVMGLNAARSEARKQDVAVNICPSTDGLTCGGTSWAQGWVVVSAAPAANAVGPVMTGPALAAGTTLTGASSPAGTPVTTLAFLSNGMILLNNTLSSNAAFTMCDNRGPSQARSIEVSLAGRVSSASGAGKTVGGAAIAGC
jgi:type IV fimbrial biogenesis protein FimT